MQVVAGAVPQGPGHQKCKSRKNIAHSRSKSCRGIFHAGIVQVLVNRWPAQNYRSLLNNGDKKPMLEELLL